ncbi:type II toxin-antitoxin system VapC family toxin [Gemmatimonas sp.]|uniref:type II toxin-antitoxin system VapC family toxin n=1 Tax=Gemmatimonas sp. TaxID=1962908 RepID=UPI003562C490
MKLLLDTQLLLWAAAHPRRLSPTAWKLINDTQHKLLCSAASLWEITTKHSLGRDDFRVGPRVLHRGLLDNGYVEVPITSEHAVSGTALPELHRDPFDPLLIAQATCEGITLVTADAIVGQYPGPMRLV